MRELYQLLSNEFHLQAIAGKMPALRLPALRLPALRLPALRLPALRLPALLPPLHANSTA